MKIFFKLFLIFSVSACLTGLTYTVSYAEDKAQEDKSLFSLFGCYDSRLGDLWSGSLFFESENKGHWLGGGYGGSLWKNAATDAEKQTEDSFNSRAGGSGAVDIDPHIRSYNLFYAYFPDPRNMPWYIGASYSAISLEEKINGNVSGMSGTIDAEWSARSFDIITGFAILNKSSLFFDVRLGYGFTSETPFKTKGKIRDSSGATYEGSSEYKMDSFLDNVFWSVSLGYSF